MVIDLEILSGDNPLIQTVHNPEGLAKVNQKVVCLLSGVDEPERSGTPFRYLLFSRNARSDAYCQISRNAFFLPFRHLFTMGGDDDYEFMTPLRFHS